MLSNFNIITLFPEIFKNWLDIGILSSGFEKNLFELTTTNLRDFGIGNYKQVDDAPYGGGPGMVLMLSLIHI